MPKLTPKALTLVIASCALLVTLSFLARGNLGAGLNYGRDPGPDSWSTSAIGYAGLFKLCEAMFGEAGRETDLGEIANVRGRLHVSTGEYPPLRPEIFKGTILIILPKWDYTPSLSNPSWVDQLVLTPYDVPQAVADGSEVEGVEVVRAYWPERFQSVLGEPYPEGSKVLQLIKGQELLPVISTPDGILLARTFLDGSPVFILSDPDIANNMGLAKGENAVLMANVMRFIMEAAKTSGPPIFLEPGEASSDSGSIAWLFKGMFRFPMIIITILTAAFIILIVIPASQRFGAPPKDANEPAYGKAKLIDNSARLLTRSGSAWEAAHNYLEMTFRAAGRLTRAPETLDRQSLAEWLDAASRSRQLSALPSVLAQRVRLLGTSTSQAELLRLARDIHKWKMELEHGSHSRRGHN